MEEDDNFLDGVWIRRNWEIALLRCTGDFQFFKAIKDVRLEEWLEDEATLQELDFN